MPVPPGSALAGIRRHFELFEESFPGLKFYGRLAAGCAADPEVAGLLSVARPGQQRPVLLFAAVHDLILRRPDMELARWYASVTPTERLATSDPWPVFRRTVLEHRRDLEEVIASRSTQTNEVNRSVLVAVLLSAACADVAEAPVHLIEMGSSAGLLLTPDRYRIDVGGVVVGDAASPVRLAGEVRGTTAPDLSTFPTGFETRTGIDLDPIPTSDVDRVRWLEACLWPDQPWRIDRFRAAIALSRADPPGLVAGDMIDELRGLVRRSPGASTAADANHQVVMDLWALTYVARRRREAVPEMLAEAARARRAVSWITAEPPGCVPGIEAPRWDDGDVGPAAEGTRPDTVLGLRRWRDGHELERVTLGWSHPHGNWIDLTP